MNNLVSYGSSSEEGEEDVPRTAPSHPSTNAEKVAKTVASRTEKVSVTPPEVDAVTDLDAPMIGPAPQSNGFDLEFPDHGLSPEIPQPTSERDTIRYLTQTTHPMTEMPPSPPGSPDPAANARIRRFLELKSKSLHFNEDLASKNTFKNPGLLSTLMTRAGVEGDEQYNTSLPSHLWDINVFPKSAYKEELLWSQQEIREKDEAAKRMAVGNRTIDFTSANRSLNSSRDSTSSLHSKRRRP